MVIDGGPYGNERKPLPGAVGFDCFLAAPGNKFKMNTKQDRGPNFRDEAGNLYLVRCYNCEPKYGRENWVVAAADGRCAWCGWKDTKPVKEKD